MRKSTVQGLGNSFVLRRENDITDVIDETFTMTEDRFGELVTVDLKPNGADFPVTEENKKEYVKCVQWDSIWHLG